VEVNATKFVRSFAKYREHSVKEPVVVKSHERVIGVFVSAEDYQIVQAAHELRQSFTLKDMPLYLMDALAKDHEKLKAALRDEEKAERFSSESAKP